MCPFFNLKQPRHRFGSVVWRSLLLALEIHGQEVRRCSVLGLCFATQNSHLGFLLAGGRLSVLSLPERPVSGHLRWLYLPPRPPPPPRPPVPSAPTPAVAAAPERMSALLKREFFGSLCLFTCSRCTRHELIFLKSVFDIKTNHGDSCCSCLGQIG